MARSLLVIALVACLAVSVSAAKKCSDIDKKTKCNEMDGCRWDVVEKECISPATKCDGRGVTKCEKIDICMWTGEKCSLAPVKSSVVDDMREMCKEMFDKEGADLVPPTVRLAFHDCVGGCDGCVDLGNPDNNGLDIPITAMTKLAKKGAKMGLSRPDVWSICAMVGNEIAQNPALASIHEDFPVLKTGRPTCAENEPEGGPHREMPSKNGNTDFVLDDFCGANFGLDARECTALLGAHNLGQAVVANSGQLGPWSRQPNCLDNGYYIGLMIRTTWFQRAIPGSGGVQWQLFDEFYADAIAALSRRKMSRKLLEVDPENPRIDPFSAVMMLNVDIALRKTWDLDEYSTAFGGEAPFYTGWLNSNFTSLEDSPKTIAFMSEFAFGADATGPPPSLLEGSKAFFPAYEAAFTKMIETLPEGSDDLLDVIM